MFPIENKSANAVLVTSARKSKQNYSDFYEQKKLVTRTCAEIA